MITPRIIKKYPNRRLYDTEASCYIKLDDIKKLVIANQPFCVIDNRTEEDVTCYILLQIINEEETGQSPFFTREILQAIIRFYGNPLQQSMREFLEKGFASFASLQPNIKDYLQKFQQAANSQNPLEKITELTKENIALWQSFFNKTETDHSNDSEKNKNRKNR